MRRVPLRTAQRWLARYRADGLAGLARPQRSDRGVRRTRPELVALIEGLALRRPRPSVATITRRAGQSAAERGWPAPSYDAGEKTVQQVADLFGVPRTIVYGHLDLNSKGKRSATASAMAPRQKAANARTSRAAPTANEIRERWSQACLRHATPPVACNCNASWRNSSSGVIAVRAAWMSCGDR